MRARRFFAHFAANPFFPYDAIANYSFRGHQYTISSHSHHPHPVLSTDCPGGGQGDCHWTSFRNGVAVLGPRRRDTESKVVLCPVG